MCLLGLAAWTAWTSRDGRGDPLGTVLLCGAAALAWSAGRWLATRTGPALPALAVTGGTATALLLGERAFSGEPLAGPLGYGNANAALHLLGVTAACVLALSPVRPDRLRAPARAVAVAGGGLLLVGAAATGSKAGAALAVVVALVAVLVHARPGAARAVVLVAAVAPLLALGAAVALAATTPDRSALLDRAVAASLTERRPQLWREAVDLVRLSPLTGGGDGVFARTSPTALSDRDARWAHAEPLEVAAEAGIPGATLLLAVAVAGTLGVARTPAGAAAAAGAGALWVHATVDHVLHFPAVPLVAATLLGVAAAQARPGSSTGRGAGAAGPGS